MTRQTYDCYPLGTVLTANAQSLAIYVSGAMIMLRLGAGWAVAYLAGVLWMECRQLKKGCVACAYYGKRCAFGKGVVSGWLFRKGKPAGFGKRKITWKDLAPDLAVVFVPFLTGLVLLFVDFRIATLGCIAVLAIACTAGNAFVRGKLACPFCKQRLKGCPAEKFFRNPKKRGS